MQSLSVTTHNNYWKIALNCSDNEKIFRSIIICKNVLLLFFPFLKFVILDSIFLLLFCVEFACSFCALWHCLQLSRDMHYRLMVFNECICNSWSSVTGTLANKAMLAKTAMLLVTCSHTMENGGWILRHDQNYCQRVQWTCKLIIFKMVALNTKDWIRITCSWLLFSEWFWCVKMVQ